MFSPKIVGSDAFLDMPTSSRELYFQLGMYADDDGFINPKRIIRMVGSSDDDLKILLAKRFVLSFESGIVVIKHWKMNNLIRKDWYQPTVYTEEKKRLKIKENGGYTEFVNENVPDSFSQVRLGKVSIVKDKNVAVGDARPLKGKKDKKKKGSRMVDRLADTTPMTLSEFIVWCKSSPHRHVQIIGEWAEAEEPEYKTRGQWVSFIQRQLKPAKQLIAFDQNQLQKAYEKMLKDVVRKDPRTGKTIGFITKYTLETLGKYI